jgi:mono/diheme cytochrome c family protein
MNVRTKLLAGVFPAAFLVALFHPPASGQITGQRNPPLVISSTSGRDLFEFYCATCHGRDGTGGGPVAPALKGPLPDLTTIAMRNGGTFPKQRIESLVTGDQDRPVTAHGSKDMPVWGPIFRALDPGDTLNRIRIANIVAHLESMQHVR